ncbi:MAG: hypothetical protein CK428_33230 [Mycobacterium sp.]|nr:MAG: hypothetical protein CK428_33230 [Mycobacterium sp.]
MLFSELDLALGFGHVGRIVWKAQCLDVRSVWELPVRTIAAHIEFGVEWVVRFNFVFDSVVVEEVVDLSL